MTVRIAFTFSSANASCKSSMRDSTDDDAKSSVSFICLPKERVNPISSNRLFAICLVSSPIRFNERDGAMTLIKSPRFSFEGMIFFMQSLYQFYLNFLRTNWGWYLPIQERLIFSRNFFISSSFLSKPSIYSISSE